MTSKKLSTWLPLVALLLLATWLAARNLNADALWYDEYWSLYNVGSPPHGSRTLLEVWNANLAANLWEPPGYYLLLNSWGTFVGWAHPASRALSLLFGLLAAAMTYRLGCDLFSPLVGLGASAALGASAFFLDYFHEIRNYTVFVFLWAFVLWAYWRMVSGRASRRTEIGFALGVAAFLYVHYYSLVALASLALYHLLFVDGTPAEGAPVPLYRAVLRKGGAWWRVVALMGIGGALFLPWAGTALQGLAKAAGGANYVVPTLAPEQVVRLLVDTFSNGSAALLALVAGCALARRDRAAGLVWFCAASILVLMLLVDARLRILIHIRHMLALWPLLALVVGLGIARLAQGGLHPALPLAVWVFAGIGSALDPAFVRSLPNTEPRLNWQGLSAALNVLRRSAAPDDVVVFHVPAGDPILGYYMYGIPAPFKRTEAFFYSPDPQADYPANARNFMRDAARVWFAAAPEMPPFYQEAEFKGALLADHALCDAPVDLPGMRLERYARVPDEPGSFQFGDGIRLALLDPLPEAPGGHLPLLLGWTLADDVPRGTYSAGLHVENAQGALVAQADYGLPDEPFGCRASDIPLDGLPPGEYTLLAVVYNWQTGERLPAVNTDTGERGERLAIGQFVRAG